MINKIHEIIWKLRPIPILASVLYGYMLWETWIWYTNLEKPDDLQSVFAGTILSGALLWFKFYVNSGRPPKEISNNE